MLPLIDQVELWSEFNPGCTCFDSAESLLVKFHYAQSRKDFTLPVEAGELSLQLLKHLLYEGVVL